ncbi:MAG: hypothetical protein ACRD1G_16905, partial [Acidimicrobiales bacterium]
MYVVCLAIFVSFIPSGVIISTLFGRRPEGINRLYFADLLGAGLACAVVVSLIASIGPPATIFLAGVMLAVGGIGTAALRRPRLLTVGVILAAVMAVFVAVPGLLPDQRLEATKFNLLKNKPIYSAWDPIFRVDVVPDTPTVLALYHDGLIGSMISRWNGQISSLQSFGFSHDVRSFPFAELGGAPQQVAIIGAAGGREALTSLYYRAGHIDAVELNPVTYRLVTQKYANYDGHLARNPKVNYVYGDGRSFLARTNTKYNLVWYPAPDSYSATNAATASAFVLSESYLYTSNAIAASFNHLGPGGIVAAQFGEVNFAQTPNRTTRYVATARRALAEAGVADPASHILVATSPTSVGASTLSTILVKRTPFTPTEVNRFVAALGNVRGSSLQYAPGHPVPSSLVTKVVTSPDPNTAYSSYRYDVRPITDNGPFFWHFAPFGQVISDFGNPIYSPDREIAVGERVMLLLLGICLTLALVFLLLPFFAVRKTWARLPRKGSSGLFFAALGLGFIFFEVTLIERLNLFLGYPTYSVTVTLASLLIFTGVGALLSGRQKHRVRGLSAVLLVAIAGLTFFYLFGLPPMTNALLGLPMALRLPIAFAVLAPLGLCLGTFLPLGLGAVAELSEYPREYVAWGWAVNGFASVIGSVLATILAMSFGFTMVLGLALAIYLIALGALQVLVR